MGHIITQMIFAHFVLWVAGSGAARTSSVADQYNIKTIEAPTWLNMVLFLGKFNKVGLEIVLLQIYVYLSALLIVLMFIGFLDIYN